MVRISVLGDALKTMYNAEKRNKRQVLIRPASKVVIKFLQLMMKHGYIGPHFQLRHPKRPTTTLSQGVITGLVAAPALS